MIDIHGLCVRKAGRTICSVAELQIAPGERVAILGPNGSGKTTLLRVLSGLELNYKGDCDVSAPMRDRVYVHQSPYMLRGTVLFNVAYGLRQRGVHRGECQRLACDWLQRFGLRDRATTRAIHLSGGERRRVALARALILQPALLILDEPLAEIDQDGVTSIASALDWLEESTILITSPTSLPSSLASRTHELQMPTGD